MSKLGTVAPCKPEPPSGSDCCGSGCVPCVFDIYEQELQIWEKECDRIKNLTLYGESSVEENTTVLSELEYRKFTITDIKKETADSYRFKCLIPFNRSLGLQIGQHIIIRKQEEKGAVTRQYTPVSDVDCKGYFELLIKIYKDGKMSRLVGLWNIGDQIEVRGPFGPWTYQSNKYRCILMLAVGTGIAPMSQIIQGILGNEDDDTCIMLLYGCRTYSDILLKEELNDWSGFWNFSVTYALSQDIDGKYRYGDQVYNGRIDGTLISQEVEGKPLDKFVVLICGTRSFDNDMKQCCENLGFKSNQIHQF